MENFWVLHPELPRLLVEALDVPNSPESVLVVGPLTGQTFGPKNTSKRGRAVDKIVLAQRFGIKQTEDDVMTCVWTNRLGDVICINACFNKKNHLHPLFPQLCQPHQSFLQILDQTFCQTSTSHPRNLIILGYPYHTTFIPMFLPFWFRTNGPNQIWGLAGESQSLAARLVVWYHLSIL